MHPVQVGGLGVVLRLELGDAQPLLLDLLLLASEEHSHGNRNAAFTEIDASSPAHEYPPPVYREGQHPWLGGASPPPPLNHSLAVRTFQTPFHYQNKINNVIIDSRQ